MQEFVVHILTKAFMIVATILSVALSGLVIAYAVNTDKIRSGYEQMQSQVDVSKAQLALQQSNSAAQTTRQSDMINTLQNQSSRASAEVTRLQQELATLQKDKQQAVADRSSIESKISELGETARTQATMLENFRSEVSTLRKNELTYKQRQLDMENTITDLQAQRDVLEQNYRALQEELAQMRQSTAVASSGSAGSSGTAAGSVPAQPFVATGPVILGRVEQVQLDPATNRTLAKLSIGSNDRVAKNMLLRIIRGNEFIANVVVQQADLSYSIGTIDTLGKAVQVQTGDTVVSRLQ